jgi:hypothetical protein
MVAVQLKVPNWLDKICAWPVTAYRRCKYGYSFRKIFLDEGLWTIVDSQDYYRFGCFKWYLAATHKGKFYALRGARVGFEETKIVRLSREIMQAPKGILVDHRNGDSLDNRRENLRLATRCQNMQNAKKRRNKAETSSKFTGVYFDKCRCLWAYILRANGKVVATGRFPTEIEAARARDAAARKYHGEFARLNFPQDLAGACPPLHWRRRNRATIKYRGEFARLNFPEESPVS